MAIARRGLALGHLERRIAGQIGRLDAHEAVRARLVAVVVRERVGQLRDRAPVEHLAPRRRDAVDEQRAVEQVVAGAADAVRRQRVADRERRVLLEQILRQAEVDVVRGVVVLDRVDVVSRERRRVQLLDEPSRDLAAEVGHALGRVADDVDRRRADDVGHVAGRDRAAAPGVARDGRQRRDDGGVIAVDVDLRLGRELIVGARRPGGAGDGGEQAQRGQEPQLHPQPPPADP